MFKEVVTMCLVAVVGCAGDPASAPGDQVDRVDCAGHPSVAQIYQGNLEDVSRSVRAYAHQTNFRNEEVTEVLPMFQNSMEGTVATAQCVGDGFVLFVRSL